MGALHDKVNGRLYSIEAVMLKRCKTEKEKTVVHVTIAKVKSLLLELIEGGVIAEAMRDERLKAIARSRGQELP